MAAIDYGALLRVNGKFINRNCGLFMDASNTGYVLERARYEDASIYDKDVDINGNFYVYAGDKDLLLTFYKGYCYVISNELIIETVSNSPFISETLHIGDARIKVSHLDPNLQIDRDNSETWEEFVEGNWIDTTGKEKLCELRNGLRRRREFLRRAKARNRYKGFKYRTNRWIAEWEHNGDKYEVIFGSGIDPCEKVWNDIKHDSYGFTKKEIETIDEWFVSE